MASIPKTASGLHYLGCALLPFVAIFCPSLHCGCGYGCGSGCAGSNGGGDGSCTARFVSGAANLIVSFENLHAAHVCASSKCLHFLPVVITGGRIRRF